MKRTLRSFLNIPLLLACLSFMSFGASLALAQTSAPTLTQSPPPTSTSPATLDVSASFADSGKPITSGLVWRIYEDKGEAVQPVIVARSSDATPHFSIAPGRYIIHASYGFASASKRITAQSDAIKEALSISSGALRLRGAVGDTPIPGNQVSFSVYVPIGSNSEGRLVLSNAHTGDTIRLPEGTYHVVSTYGDANAIMAADLKVNAGQVTEATLNHRAAIVTLKLVSSEGGEAFAGTAFSVLTPGGDVIREAIGAFPSVMLAEGDYVLIARHDGKVQTREFKVESGLNRDIEIVATP